MLSRVANAVYWMSRYLERAGNLARFVDVNWHLTLDLPGSGPEAWRSLIIASGDKALFEERYGDYDAASVITFLCFDADYLNSIHSCLWAGRENARAIREVIPYEMWEQINITYHFVQDMAKRPLEVVENPYDFCQQIKQGDFIVGGIEGDAMIHDEAWHFARLGRLLERCDKTSRILDVNCHRMLPEEGDQSIVFDSIHWSALLRATSALNAFRRCRGRISPAKVAEFLLLDQEFPRSVLHGLIQAQHSLHAITGTAPGHYSRESERLLGQLRADLSYLTIDEVFDQGLHRFTDRLQTRMNAADACLGREFFGYPGGVAQVQVEQ
ncbi:alpha-E domain-containing protein [Fundidesulfovibrio agrisoli]|uniref:alpha-E domain-containing protein n=1 Tax=Fundidesulfovibrio agrisoli TaxID=2922717 RepID=UPI001FACEBA8|nr:alpha-E domain-containing protein [Fundidesulfovibrio agrisoli]